MDFKIGQKAVQKLTDRIPTRYDDITKEIAQDKMRALLEEYEKYVTPPEKEVTYLVIVDRDGKEISREKKNETITKEATTEIIERGTNDSASTTFGMLWIICLIIAFYQAFKHKDGNLLLNKIQKQKNGTKVVLYILYVFTVIPAFIDVVKIIINKIKNKKN